MSASRFAARPLAVLLDQLADCLAWPRSRSARLLSGERAARAATVFLCVDEGALAALDPTAGKLAMLASPLTSSAGRRGRRAYDPFVGSDEDVTTWARAEQLVVDASLLIAGGRRGVDERLAAAIGLQQLAPLRSLPRDADKLVCYVPVDALETVRDAVFAAGAGQIGDYDRCSWSTVGTGTFRGGADTSPTIGTPGSFEQVQEARFEVVVPSHRIDHVCRALVAAHPYEEPAFDVVPLAIPAPVGFGRVGSLGGGGAAVWTALSKIDPALEVHGSADKVAAGARGAVYSGPVRDVLDALFDDEFALLAASSATEAELDVLAERGVAVLLFDRARAVESCAGELAGMLSRALTVPVSVQPRLHFPGSSQDAPPAPVAAAPAPAASPDAGTWRLHFDGGSRGNPGPAAYGWALYDPDGAETAVDAARVGTATNNVAEWTGLLRGLEHAAQLGVRRLEVRGDSELVVKQVNGQYRVKNEALKPLAEEVKQLMRRFDLVRVTHVYRDDNARADALTNEALDGVR